MKHATVRVLAIVALVMCGWRVDAGAPRTVSVSQACSRGADAQMSASAVWNDVASSYESVRDYTCLYLKEEGAISNGELQTIRLFFRKPLDVRLEWLNDNGEVDQTAVYRKGFNDDKVLARRRGMLGAVAGTLRLDPHDRLALQDSRHPITEAGIVTIVEVGARDMRNPDVRTRLAGSESVDGHESYKIEFETRPGTRLLGVEGASTGLVWIDRELKLPIQVEVRDAKGILLERHRFTELRLNVGLTDQTFTI